MISDKNLNNYLNIKINREYFILTHDICFKARAMCYPQRKIKSEPTGATFKILFIRHFLFCAPLIPLDSEVHIFMIQMALTKIQVQFDRSFLNTYLDAYTASHYRVT